MSDRKLDRSNRVNSTRVTSVVLIHTQVLLATRGSLRDPFTEKLVGGWAKYRFSEYVEDKRRLIRDCTGRNISAVDCNSHT